MDKSENPKSRGWQHRSNKKKYSKNKAAANVPVPKPRVTLESNWDRYEQKSEESKVSGCTDFSVLAHAPITHGSHFQFKSDKDYVLEISESANTTSLFNLDLALLEKSLATIPFNVRSGIAQGYFTENQQKVMTALEDNIFAYDTYLKGHQNKKDADVIFGSEDETSDNDNDALEDNASAKLELSQEVCKVTGESDPCTEQGMKSDKEGEEDLEQWLDDILDT